MKLGDANVEVYEKNFFARPLSCNAFILSDYITIISSKEALKVVLLVIYLFSHDYQSQLSACWIWHLTFSWVQILPNNKLKFFVSCNIRITRTSFFWLCVLICSFFIKTWLFSIMVIIIFCFDICTKFTLSTIISTMKEWQHLTWCV